MLWICGRCGTAYAVGLPYCPQCTSTDCRPQGEKEEQVPKNTVHGGPSNADEPAAAEPAAVEVLDQLDEVLEAANAGSADEAAGATAEPRDGYEALTVEALREELDARRVVYTQRERKDELVAKLRAADAAEADDPE